MKVYDPHAHTVRDYDDCEVLSSAAGYTPVKSLKEDRWFALHMPTGTSHRFGDLDSDERVVLERRVSTAQLTEKLTAALRLIEEGVLPSASADESRARARGKAEKDYGLVAFGAAVAFARHEGHSYDAIGHALTALDQEPTDAALLEGVSVTKISELLEDA